MVLHAPAVDLVLRAYDDGVAFRYRLPASDSRPLGVVADHFRKRGFSSLPVVAEDGRFLGVIFQLDLIQRAREDAFRLHRSLLAALVRLIDDHRSKAPLAQDIMRTAVQRVTPMTPVGALLPMLDDGGTEAVPVVVGPKIDWPTPVLLSVMSLISGTSFR